MSKFKVGYVSPFIGGARKQFAAIYSFGGLERQVLLSVHAGTDVGDASVTMNLTVEQATNLIDALKAAIAAIEVK